MDFGRPGEADSAVLTDSGDWYLQQDRTVGESARDRQIGDISPGGGQALPLDDEATARATNTQQY